MRRHCTIVVTIASSRGAPLRQTTTLTMPRLHAGRSSCCRRCSLLMRAASGTTTLQTVCGSVAQPLSSFVVDVTQSRARCPLATAGNLRPSHARSMSSSSRCNRCAGQSRACPPCSYLTPAGLLQGDQTRPTLGCGTTAVPPHTRTGLQETWDFQSRGGRGGGARGRRERGILPARRRSLAWDGCARRAKCEQTRAQPNNRAR